MRVPSFIRALLAVTAALIMAVPAHAQAVSGQGTWETTLLGRDINLNPIAATDANAVYLYDKTLDVTWLRDASVNGMMDWNAATNWASNLVTGSGTNSVSGWRLPAMADPAAACMWGINGTNCGGNVATSSSEMASLFYYTLRNKTYVDTSGNPQAGWGLTNTGSFQNMQSNFYWLGTTYAPDAAAAWSFAAYNGQQVDYAKSMQFYAMAVHSGDVASVAEPETYAMLLTGLGLIGVIGRRRRVGPKFYV